MVKTRFSSFSNLTSIGKAFIEDFDLLGITNMKELASSDPEELYERLCTITKKRHCVCAKDVFYCAVAQAHSPNLPEELRQWYTWSRLRKAGKMQEELKRILSS